MGFTGLVPTIRLLPGPGRVPPILPVPAPASAPPGGLGSSGTDGLDGVTTTGSDGGGDGRTAMLLYVERDTIKQSGMGN